MQPPNLDSASGALQAQTCVAVHAVSAVRGWPGDNLAPVQVPGAVRPLATSPAAPLHMAENLCGAWGILGAKLVVRLLERWSAAIATPSMRAHMGLAGLHDMGTHLIRHVLLESQKVWLAHARAHNGLIKAHSGPGGHNGSFNCTNRQSGKASSWATLK